MNGSCGPYDILAQCGKPNQDTTDLALTALQESSSGSSRDGPRGPRSRVRAWSPSVACRLRRKVSQMLQRVKCPCLLRSTLPTTTWSNPNERSRAAWRARPNLTCCERVVRHRGSTGEKPPMPAHFRARGPSRRPRVSSALQVEDRSLMELAQDGEPIVRRDPSLQVVCIDEDDKDVPLLVGANVLVDLFGEAARCEQEPGVHALVLRRKLRAEAPDLVRAARGCPVLALTEEVRPFVLPRRILGPVIDLDVDLLVLRCTPRGMARCTSVGSTRWSPELFRARPMGEPGDAEAAGSRPLTLLRRQSSRR